MQLVSAMFSIALIAVPDLSGKEHPLMAGRSCGLPATAALELGVSVSSRALPCSRVSDLSGRRGSVEGVSDPVLLECLRSRSALLRTSGGMSFPSNFLGNLRVPHISPEKELNALWLVKVVDKSEDLFIC